MALRRRAAAHHTLSAQTAMRALGFPVKKAEVKSLMSSYDIDGSGKIEYTDFVDISAWAMPRAFPPDTTHTHPCAPLSQ